MPGFDSITGDETIVSADNVSFDGTRRGGKVTTNGQILIGSTVAPHIRVGSLSSSDGSVVITPGAGTIDLSATSSGSSTYFRAYLTSPQSIPTTNQTTAIIFDTAVVNIGSAYDTSTGVFTAPATGFYSFSATIFFEIATAATQILLAFLGSAESLRLCQLLTGDALVSCSWCMQMTIGDTVVLTPYEDGTGNFNVYGSPLSSGVFNVASTFSGFRVA